MHEQHYSQNKQSETAYRQGDWGSQDPDYVWSLTGTSLSKDTCVIKSNWNCGKMPYLALLKNAFKNSWIQICRRISSSLTADKSVVKFLWRSVQLLLRKVANRQTDREISTRHYVTSLAEVTMDVFFMKFWNGIGLGTIKIDYKLWVILSQILNSFIHIAERSNKCAAVLSDGALISILFFSIFDSVIQQVWWLHCLSVSSQLFSSS